MTGLGLSVCRPKMKHRVRIAQAYVAEGWGPRGFPGYRAECDCGWRGIVRVAMRHASQDCDEHLRRRAA